MPVRPFCLVDTQQSMLRLRAPPSRPSSAAVAPSTFMSPPGTPFKVGRYRLTPASNP
jgi:hypothetical protein